MNTFIYVKDDLIQWMTQKEHILWPNDTFTVQLLLSNLGWLRKNKSRLPEQVATSNSSIIEGRKVESVGGTFCWPSLENYTKYHTCLQAFKCLHGLTLAYPLNGSSFSCKHYAFNNRYRDLLQLPLLKHRNIKVPLVTKVQMRGILWPINYETWLNWRPNFKKLLKLHLCNWCDVLWNVMYAFYLKCKL